VDSDIICIMSTFTLYLQVNRIHSFSTFHRSSLTVCSSACPSVSVDVRNVCQTRRRHSSGASQFHSATLSSTPGDWPTYYTSSRYLTLHRWLCEHCINIWSGFCVLYLVTSLYKVDWISTKICINCINATVDVVETFFSRWRWSTRQQAQSREQGQHG